VKPSDPGDDPPRHLDVAALRAAAEERRKSPAWLWAHLRAVLGDVERLTDLAKSSEFHPNGFAKIVLLPRASPRMRLHIWHPDMRGGGSASNVHGHRWPFASWIITGQLRETTYIEVRRGEPFDVYCYMGAGRNAPYLKLGSRLLAPSETTRRVRGDIYAREPHEQHVAEPVGEGLVASLVLHGPPVEWTPIHVASGSSEPGRSEPITPHQLRALLTDVIDILQPVA
jgi:hypothetical protein